MREVLSLEAPVKPGEVIAYVGGGTTWLEQQGILSRARRLYSEIRQ